MRKHTALQKIAVLLSALCLLMGVVPARAATTNEVAVQSAALTTQSAPQNGMVRVWLSSLGSPSRLDLTVAGSYSLGGDLSRSFSGGTSLTVHFNSATGQLTLSQSGVVIYTGGDFSLRRHSTAGTNGIRIAQARERGNPYPGDLSFQAVRQSSGNYKLYVIAHVYIEDYLYGVVPYEMGNSSNVEALKAQAVAARTYTVRMMSRRASGRYDVVDTTSDQVYRGTPSGNANCVTAVDSTRGIVLKYGGEYVMTYYSASNGGQTESAPHGVGSGAYAYFTVKDDPFDYDNPGSTVKKKTVYKDLTSASNPSGLISLLQQKAAAQLGQSVTPVSLQSVTPHTPKYEAPSRLYTKMDFALTVRNSGGGLQNVTVTCDIFSELESLLGMSIQSAKNELWSVEETASGFSLQARRYGHGVGMSQRRGGNHRPGARRPERRRRRLQGHGQAGFRRLADSAQRKIRRRVDSQHSEQRNHRAGVGQRRKLVLCAVRQSEGLCAHGKSDHYRHASGHGGSRDGGAGLCHGNGQRLREPSAGTQPERQKTWNGPDGRGADGVFPFGGLGLCAVYEHHGLCPSQLSFCADHGLSGAEHLRRQRNGHRDDS